jgi:AraC-like DNA-binding protein
MDPLSHVLSLVKPRSYAAGGLTAGGRWAICFPAYEGIKCYVVARGECWVVIDSVAEPFHVATGECLMLPHGCPFRLCSDLEAPPSDMATLYSGYPYNGIRAVTPGDDFFLLGGHFVLGENADLLLGVLPPFVHLRKESDKAELRGAVERMLAELRDPQPGGSLIAQQSAYTMLVLALRLYLAEGERGGVGWLFALADRQIGGAIAAIHDRPSHAWTVQTLAEKVGMSRTTFAERFRRTVGSSPLDYLTRWRMLLAGDRLCHSKDSISVIAEAVGYESESAFSAAFKRTMGASPREYARGRNRSLPAR